MTVALGLSHYGLAIYHLITHACFKALLFLGAGVVIHATSDIQDLRRQGGAHSALPYAWAVFLLGSLSLVGWPFLAGYYSKDAILELSWATPGAIGNYAHFILMTVAALTCAYSFRVLYAAFGTETNARRKENSAPGVPYTMAFPLRLLAAGSIFAGYLISDALIGWGTPAWQQSVINSPQTLFSVESHMIPVWAAWLPFMTVFVGMLLALSYTWPLPYCVQGWTRAVYLFLQARWQFDFVFNQQIRAPVMHLATQTWALLDKGILELLGPRGMTTLMNSWATPTVRRWQTGTVHDYALVFQICVIVGCVLVAFPQFWILTF